MELIAASPAELTNLCHRNGWITSDARIHRSDTAGAGNMNHTLRVWFSSVRAPTRSLVLKQSLPFVARFPQIPAPIERGRIEAAFYECIASDSELSGHTPELLGFDAEHHVLCMSDLGAGRDLTSMYKLDDATTAVSEQAQLLPLLQWLGRLHALPVPTGFPDNCAMRRLNHEHIFSVPFNPDSGVALSPELEQLRSRLAAQPHFLESVRQLGDIYLGNRPFASQPALLHGDFYPGSWLDTEGASCHVIDPEFGFVGPPEFDVGVLCAHLTFAGYSAQRLEELLGSYQRSPGFSRDLLLQFSAIETLRRLLGVAQLPLTASPQQQLQWAQTASARLNAV